MKKVLLFAFVLILTACSAQAPQVTVTFAQRVTVTFAQRVTVTLPPPTATIIPTPTLHPEFLALQQQVAANGTKYSLGSDGILKDETGEQVKGIEINSATGEITIMVNDAEVTIEADKVSISDGGITIEGYSFDVVTGNSVIDLASSEAAQPTMTLLNELGVTVGADGIVELKMDGDKVVIIEKSTGEEVGRDGLLTLDFLHEALGKLDVVGGLVDSPNPNGSRGHQPENNSPIRADLITAASQFRGEYEKLFGVPYRDDPKNGRIEFVLFPDNHWAVAAGRIINGQLVFDHLVFRPKGNESAVKWYPMLLRGNIDSIWADEIKP